MKKCLGCGIVLQDNDLSLDGYTKDLTKDFCKRCFKMRNYGVYNEVILKEDEYLNIVKEVGKKNNLTLLVVDLLSIPKNLDVIRSFLSDKTVLVLNKRDLLPLKVDDSKYISYFSSYNFLDIVVISTYKNYNLDLLYETILKYCDFKDVYIVGATNAGKSSLINKLVNNYSVNKSDITISPMPSTTLKEITVKFQDFNLIDTPGLITDKNISLLDNKMIKKITSHKEIKPITYQIKYNDSIIIEDVIRIDYLSQDKNSFTIYMSNELDIKRVYSKKNITLKNKELKKIKIGYKEDLVIPGIGFIKVVYPCDVILYTNFEVYKRKSLI